MNDTIKTILARRSVRSYLQKQITDEELQAVLEAGKFAPSAMNQQPCHFVAVQNKEVMEKISNGCKAAIGRDIDPFYHAPTIVIVFADQGAIAPVQDASLALENMMIAAASLGLSSCWIHSVNAFFTQDAGKEMKKEWGIPDDYMSVGSCILGYNAGEMPSAPPRKQETVTIIK
ncbi:MAG: nitroreductase [Clostridia bacterium]|jgi:nitroreductase|nr:nitroreductase [Clostridia bacterium]